MQPDSTAKIEITMLNSLPRAKPAMVVARIQQISTIMSFFIFSFQKAPRKGPTVYFFLLFPALLMAIATACFWGLPACISFLILEEMVFCEEPDFKGVMPPSFAHDVRLLAVYKLQATVRRTPDRFNVGLRLLAVCILNHPLPFFGLIS